MEMQTRSSDGRQRTQRTEIHVAWSEQEVGWQLKEGQGCHVDRKEGFQDR